MQRSYRTPKGTELPLLNLRGREYLEVKYRLVWFREEHPDWAIETELLSVTQDSAYARAVIKDVSGRIIATSHKFETKKGFPDFIEKAETGSIGRALALIGFGTQFCADELDEGDRIVDAPVDRAPYNEASLDESVEGERSKDPADYRISFGKKYKGMKLREIPRSELEGYIEWLEDNAAKKGLPLSEEARFLKVAVGRYLDQNQNQSSSSGGEAGSSH
ncbi:MAG: hypothetical protein AAB250_13085 [Bdellovibrionota bacterium]